VLDFRLAAAEDSAEILAWRNDVHTRSMMLTTSVIDPETHAAWFAASLANPKRIMIIAQKRQSDGGAATVAIVRFDISNGEATVAINMNPVMRGLGLAASSLLGAERYLPPEREIMLIAEIKSTNTASRRTFERAGYQVSPEPIGMQSATIRYHKRWALGVVDSAD
jgi:RimJ/RimL family protein N-acetyltransferase